MLADAPSPRARSILTFLLLTALGFAAGSVLDSWAFANVVDARVYERDWGRMFRIVGYVPLWTLLAAALVLHDRGDTRRIWRRGGLLLGSALLGGIAAELLKLLLRRERPRITGGSYSFRPFTVEPFDTGGLALPSSHALVAFAGAAMLARLFPRSAPVWYLLAAGCAVTRVMSQSHYVSDVVLAGFIGYGIAALLWWWKGKELIGGGSPAPVP